MTTEFFEPASLDPTNPGRTVIDCIESGCRAMLIDLPALPEEFFDLSTRLIGDLVHRLGMYGIPLAVVIGSTEGRSSFFVDFVREANQRNGMLQFTEERAAAEEWLRNREGD